MNARQQQIDRYLKREQFLDGVDRMSSEKTPARALDDALVEMQMAGRRPARAYIAPDVQVVLLREFDVESVNGVRMRYKGIEIIVNDLLGRGQILLMDEEHAVGEPVEWSTNL